jgi:hypothetical protein
LFPLDFGIDIFVVTTAAAREMEIKEGIYSLKLHESTTQYLQPESSLIPMFRQVTGTMFELAKHYQDFWMNRGRNTYKKLHKECFAPNPIPVQIDVDALQKSFKKEYKSSKKLIQRYLPEKLALRLNEVSRKIENLDSQLWAEIVYTFASSYKNLKRKSEKLEVLDILKTIWFGRFVSYAIETRDVDINAAEGVIQKQAKIFEENFDYLLSIY